ncbi:lysozyme inhibitor LprI family protein [Pseudovibrio axinellae]|nr:lysozyme inhibitor LprI family protein [Pseudovibrio axinellae]
MTVKDRTSTGISKCYARETALWEKMIAAAEKDLRLRQDKPTMTEMQEANVNWKAFRNNACNIPFTMKGEQRMAPILELECFNRVTAFWALQLSEFTAPREK